MRILIEVLARPLLSRAVRCRTSGIRTAGAVLASLAAYGLWGLTLPQSEIRVSTVPAGATVVIDNWFRGETPSAHRLPLGSHEVRIRANGYQQESYTVALGLDPARIEAKLRPISAP